MNALSNSSNVMRPSGLNILDMRVKVRVGYWVGLFVDQGRLKCWIFWGHGLITFSIFVLAQ